MTPDYNAAGAPVPAVSSNDHAEPSYPMAHTGPVLVCGFGPTFYDDLERARQLRPDAPAIAVNEAAKAVKTFALFTLHPEKLRRFCALQVQSFGDGFTVHSGGKAFDVQDRPRKYLRVDYWWREAAGGGTSAWAAARMARLMGFDEIILTGVPLVHGNYADLGFAKAWRVGQKREDGRDMLDTYRAYVENDTSWHEGVTSMSGWTRDLFGEPR